MKRLFLRTALLTVSVLAPLARAQNSPVVSLVVNAESGSAVIAPNTWVEINGSNLAKAGDVRIWGGSDFVNGQMPTNLDGVSVTVNGKNAYVYYISPTQINVLTPPDTMPGTAPVVVTNNGASSTPFNALALPISPAFFVFGDGKHAAAVHSDGSLLGPASLSVPGYTFTPANPGETVQIYANGFGPTNVPLVTGSATQSGSLSPLPVVEVAGISATVSFAGLVFPGEFQFNVVIPPGAPAGDQSIVAAYGGSTTQVGTVIAISGSAPPATGNFYVALNGNDSWTGTLAAPNAANTNGPFASFDRARKALQSLNKTGMTQASIQFRGGTYYLPATVQLGAADSGSANLEIFYQNYPGETPVFSGGVRVQNWTNTGGNTWKTTLPASTQYFENLFYNGARRLRPRLGGYLGTYYRSAATVYLSAPGPPAKAPDPHCSVYVMGSGWECFDRFQYNPSDPISNTWKNLAPPLGNPCGQAAGNAALAGDIEVLDFEQFSTSKLRVSCVDMANHIVYLTGGTAMPQNNASETGFIAGNRYLVENVQDQLTQPGQWFLDRSTTPWTLTYLANPGENPNTDTVIIPQLPIVVAASNLQFVTFQGLTFAHNNYTIPAAGYVSVELEPNIPSAVSFQNSQHLAFDSGIVTQTSGSGLEIISCTGAQSPSWCVSNNANATSANSVVRNSAFYDVGTAGIRVGEPGLSVDTDANVPQSITVENNVVASYGRLIPAAFGIGQGVGHNNVYIHNDVYDGYHCAISISENLPDMTKPNGSGASNNTISFNHVYNLLQGIMNDGGSIRVQSGNNVHSSPGNKILNNKIHDVTDASIQDANGYGGHGIYMDNHTGLVDVENNLVYRVSASAVYTPHGPAAPNEANTIKNNILAFARMSMVDDSGPYVDGLPSSADQAFVITNNLFYFDRNTSSNPPFHIQDGCTYAGGFAFVAFQQFSSNLYWGTDGGFANDSKGFHVQPNPGSGPNAPCSDDKSTWTYYTFSQWQQKVGEDVQSVVQNPGFNNPAYPADDYSLPKGSPGVGFVVFDFTQAGRSNPVIHPPGVAATFPTRLFNPATDY